MRFRVYGAVKDVKTEQAVIGASVRLYLDKEELQQVKSAKNGFYEIIVEIDDSRIENGQQLRIIFEMENYQTQEHRVLATEGAFNLDAALEAAAPPPKKPFNLLPVIIVGGGVLLLLVVGVILFLVLRPKTPKIISFSADPNSIESGQFATLSWETSKASSVGILIDQNEVSVELTGNKKVQPIQTTEYILIAKNDKGVTMAYQTVEVKDVLPPELAVTISPSSPNTEEKVTFTATASDPGGISKIEILVKGTKVTECAESPCTYEGGSYTLGSVSYEAYAWDKSDNKAVAGPNSFMINDVGAPKITISYSPAKPSTEDKVTFTVISSDPGGISKVQIYVKDNKVEECTGSPCRYIGGPYPLGDISYYAYAYDNSGNKASSGSNSITIIDKIPPNVTITPNPFTVNLNQKVTFTAKASDPGGISKIQIYINEKRMNECKGSPCTYTGGPYALGHVKYQAYAWDNSGNRSQTEAITLTVMNFNFESGSLEGWSKTGTAFNYQPTLGDNPSMRHQRQPSKHQGNYWIGTFEKRPSKKFAVGGFQGDEPTGALTSRYFVIQSPQASFLVGGGSGPGVGVQLKVDGIVVLQARGKNNETMGRVTWDLTKYVNKTAQLRILDYETGGWGHINFDDFQFVQQTLPIWKFSPVKPLNILNDLSKKGFIENRGTQ